MPPFIVHLLCSRHFEDIFSFHSHNNSRDFYDPPYYGRYGESERLSNLPKAAQQSLHQAVITAEVQEVQTCLGVGG